MDLLWDIVKAAAFGLLVFGIMILVWYILIVIARWGLFVKMGEPGWKSLIPFYSDYVLFGKVWSVYAFWAWLALLIVTWLFSDSESTFVNIFMTLCSIALFLVGIFKCYNLSRAFGHGVGFTIGLILLEPIFTMILSFGQSVYLGNPTQWHGGYHPGGYDGNGYNQNGYNQNGYNQNGYNQNGYNQNGYSQNGYDQNGYDQNGYNRNDQGGNSGF